MSTERALLGIDAGTTAVKVALFDVERLRPVAEARRRVPVERAAPGRVEQDPLQVLEAVCACAAEVIASRPGADVVAAGLDHQGESVLAWEAGGAPLTPIVGWQDKRQQELLDRIDARAVARSGLPLDPYFSAGKLAWLLTNDDAVQRAARDGTLRLGTVDAFLTDRLCGRFATDLSTASRTQLLAVGGRDWDAELLDVFGIERRWLPAIGPTFGDLGELRADCWPAPMPLAAQLVDQQAALAGSGAVASGELKATYGTGVFVLGHTDAPRPPPGLLPTVAWAGAGREGGIGDVRHAFDGGVFAAGSLLDWMAHDLGLAADAPALARAAAAVEDSAGVQVLPALAGLGAPWWQPRAHAVIAGLHGGVRPAHLGRAALEAIAHRVADIVDAVAVALPVRSVRVDGGLTNDELLLRLQADALGIPIQVAPAADQTALGAALLAGVGAGTYADVADAAARLPPGRIVQPTAAPDARVRERERWRAFVQASARL
jgi:glycerol kinase